MIATICQFNIAKQYNAKKMSFSIYFQVKRSYPFLIHKPKTSICPWKKLHYSDVSTREWISCRRRGNLLILWEICLLFSCDNVGYKKIMLNKRLTKPMFFNFSGNVSKLWHCVRFYSDYIRCMRKKFLNYSWSFVLARPKFLSIVSLLTDEKWNKQC